MARSLVLYSTPDHVTRQFRPTVRACGACNAKGGAGLRLSSRSKFPLCRRASLCHSRKQEQNADSDQTGKEHEQFAVTNVNPQTRVAISVVQAYKDLISPVLPSVCRFLPSCSTYSVQAFEQFGAGKGVILMGWRILRCNPFRGGYQGQYDPPQWPPVGLEALFRF